MRRLALILLFAALGTAQDVDAEPAKPSEEERAAYQKGLDYLRKKRWSLAQKTFRGFMRKYPNSRFLRAAANRSDDNCYLGTEVLWKSGPPATRIDVAVMGDGFIHDASGQKKQEKWAKLCVDILFNEPAFSRYRNYFNIYFVRLCSLEEGVDPQLSPEQRKKLEEKNRYRSKSRQKKTNFSTALDAKAAGPQGQVMMDRRLVYKWQAVAEKDVPGVGDDKYVIAFAQFGRLGMGGGGIANVGRPDKSVTTHEFGHAFSRLLDEYANNPNRPRRAIRAANAYSSDTEPKRDEVPWAHMLKKRVKGVGIHEGGATFKKGVWRPAASCAMNSAGATGFCPVCREQTIRVIYEYVDPIEDYAPQVTDGRVIRVVAGDEKFLMVQPMEPYKAKLKVSWYVTDFAVTKSEGSDDMAEDPEVPEVQLPGVDGATPEADSSDDPEDDPDDPFPSPGGGARRGGRGRAPGWAWGGWRVRQDRSKYANPPSGVLRKWAKIIKAKGKGSRRVPAKHLFPLAKLGPGHWRITCQVEDTTRWVIKDPKHLLKERVTWTIHVKPKPVEEKK